MKYWFFRNEEIESDELNNLVKFYQRSSTGSLFKWLQWLGLAWGQNHASFSYGWQKSNFFEPSLLPSRICNMARCWSCVLNQSTLILDKNFLFFFNVYLFEMQFLRGTGRERCFPIADSLPWITTMARTGSFPNQEQGTSFLSPTLVHGI